MAKVTWAVDGAVRTVLLNRPDKRNALDAEMIAELQAAFTKPPAAEERLAVVRAAGPVFCAGLDMKERSAKPMGASPIEAMLHTIEVYPLPVVAVVQGDAIAGGNELAMHCDLVVASKAARFGMSLAQIGLAPSWFLAKKLLEVAGPVTTRRILLLGDPLPAERCDLAHCRARRARIRGGVCDPKAQRECAAVAQGHEGADRARDGVPRPGPARGRGSPRRGGATLGRCAGGHRRAACPPPAQL
jgi:hypothetical protein